MPDQNSSKLKPDELRPAKPGDSDTTRFGTEDGDNTDVPATGVDPDRQSQDRK